MGYHEPVTDWATDFDHTDEVWAADPHPIWDGLRRTCPMAHSARYGGVWLPTRHDDVAAIAYDTERFTSRSVVVTEFRPPLTLAPEGIAPPIITHLLNSELDGQMLDPFHVVRTIGLLLLAGIDTTWSAIGASIWHLAGNPGDRERLVAEPELLPVAMEELLRAYSPVTMARLVKQDMDWNGCPMKAEEWVLLPFPSAKRDPTAFQQADQVVIDRHA